MIEAAIIAGRAPVVGTELAAGLEGGIEVESLHYDVAAIRGSVEGWKCVKCGRFNVLEHYARLCCSTNRPCSGCGKDTEKHRIFCESCQEKQDTDRYYAKEERDWDGVVPLCSDNEIWFWSLNDLLEHLETDNPSDDQIDSLRLEICVHGDHPHFDLVDYLSDYLPEEMEPPGDYETPEKAVNDYIEKHSPLSWTTGKYRPSISSIQVLIKKESQ